MSGDLVVTKPDDPTCDGHDRSKKSYENFRTRLSVLGDHGYVVTMLLDDAQLNAALENVYEYMPSWEEYARRPGSVL